MTVRVTRNKLKRVHSYSHENVKLSTHANRNCLISYGYETLYLQRKTAAAVLKKLRAGERIRYRQYGDSLSS